MLNSILRKFSRPRSRTLSLTCLIASATSLSAQTTPTSATDAVGYREQIAPSAGTITVPNTAVVPENNNLKLSAMFEHDFKADLKSGAAGNLNVNQFELRGDYALNLSAKDRLIVGAEYMYLNFEFNGGPAPFGNVQQVGANVYYTHGFDGGWGMFGFLYGGSAAESSGSMNHGGQGGVAVGPTWDTGKNLTLAFGPMYFSRIEDHGAVTLMLNMDWAFAPQWNLYLYTGISSGATVTYDLFNDHKTIVDASLMYDSFWFAARDNPAGARQGVNQTDMTLKVGIRQALTPAVFLRGYAAAIFEREYQFHVDDHSTNSFKVDPTLGVGVEIGLAF